MTRDIFSIINTFNEDDLSYSYRLYALNVSIDYFLKYPLFGNGWDAVRGLLEIPPHSNIIQILGELGITGLIFEILIYLRLLKLFKQNYIPIQNRNDINNSQLIIRILFSTLAGFLFWGLFENIGFIIGNRLLFIITGILFSAIIINSNNKFIYIK